MDILTAPIVLIFTGRICGRVTLGRSILVILNLRPWHGL